MRSQIYKQGYFCRILRRQHNSWIPVSNTISRSHFPSNFSSSWFHLLLYPFIGVQELSKKGSLKFSCHTIHTVTHMSPWTVIFPNSGKARPREWLGSCPKTLVCGLAVSSKPHFYMLFCACSVTELCQQKHSRAQLKN